MGKESVLKTLEHLRSAIGELTGESSDIADAHELLTSAVKGVEELEIKEVAE